MKTKLAAASMMLLGACANQDYAGITDVSVEFKDVCQGAMHECLKSVHWRDGKESATMNVSLAGIFDYSRADTRAFEAHKIRAAVEKSLHETIGTAAPEVVDAIVRAVISSMVVPGVGAALPLVVR